MGYTNKDKQKEYQARWYQANKARYLARQRELRQERYAIVDKYKLSHGCSRCGYNEAAIALDAHHCNGDKEFSIAKAINERKSLDIILTELAKCVILCANCHRIETWSR